ncbi:hypothetical protein MTR67_040168 [Solanum verrucosum]|uniref:Uncharacterized protein n=1 Tax=Solanum verrucosum TaxID=315347 RepID=A0AAF0UJY3_SOLVR|nr:hypothetical protein MTR67_040168 [Solanum verrucosum]
MLKKCMGDPSLIIPAKDIGSKDNLSYEEIPVQIIDRQEAEEDMKKRYPHLFESGEIPDQGFWNRPCNILTKLRTQNNRVLRKARRLTTDSGVLSWINGVLDADPGYLCLHRYKMQAN